MDSEILHKIELLSNCVAGMKQLHKECKSYSPFRISDFNYMNKEINNIKKLYEKETAMRRMK